MSDFDEIWINGERLATLEEDVPAEITLDSKTGLSSGSLTYQCRWDRAVELTRVIRTHPTYPWLIAKTAKITREEALMARVVVSYEGIDDDADEEETKTYSLEGSTSSEPIETHPKFPELAGDWKDRSTWINGATFEDREGSPDQGKFLGFTIKDGAPNKKAGVKSYLAAGIIYTENRIYTAKSLQTVRVNMNKLGNIDDPPSSPFLPEVSAGYNWLMIGCDASQVGKGMKLARKWRLSGPNGWDADWYED